MSVICDALGAVERGAKHEVRAVVAMLTCPTKSPMFHRAGPATGKSRSQRRRRHYVETGTEKFNFLKCHIISHEIFFRKLSTPDCEILLERW